MVYWTEAHSELCQRSRMKRFAELVNKAKLLTVFEKRSILDV